MNLDESKHAKYQCSPAKSAYLIGGSTDAQGFGEGSVEFRNSQVAISNTPCEVGSAILILPGCHIIAIKPIWLEALLPPPRTPYVSCREYQYGSILQLLHALCTGRSGKLP